MTSWTTLARAGTASGDDILLRQRGPIFEIRYNGIELMSNLNHQSEDQLALRSLRRIDFRARKILIGGLGLGFTLRAVLNLAAVDACVTVCELIPEVAAWNRGPLAHLADHPLDDPRTNLRIEDVQAHLAQSEAAYDLILLDTDNGPDFLIRTENTGLYQDTGLAMVANALTDGGLAVFWSATASPAFERRLSAHPWAWLREDIPLVPGRVDAMHHIYSCSRNAAVLGLRPAA
ncbi:spermidine synthase [Pontitalea aquivivens]|uniref:spermidine synthase n=1 Tax=Pontitalea aquivivens TaxID=3388663 RepID=UPI003970583E